MNPEASKSVTAGGGEIAPLLLLPPGTTSLYTLVLPASGGVPKLSSSTPSTSPFSLLSLLAMLRRESTYLVRQTKEILLKAGISEALLLTSDGEPPLEEGRCEVPPNSFILQSLLYMQSLLRQHRQSQESGSVFCSPHHPTATSTLSLLQFLTWTCLETTLGSGQSSGPPAAGGKGGRGSAGGSGTDSVGGPAGWQAKRQQRVRFGAPDPMASGGRRGGATSSSVCATPVPGRANPARFSGSLADWRRGGEGKGESRPLVSDHQCAESLFSVLLSDFLVTLAKGTADPRSLLPLPLASPAPPPSAPKAPRGQSSPPSPSSSSSNSFAVAVHFYALSLLAVALLRYEPLANGAFLTHLLPAEEGLSCASSVCSGASSSSSGSQETLVRTTFPACTPLSPILFPLLYSRKAELRWAAALALQHSLQYLSCFNIAEEPHARRVRGGSSSRPPASLSFIPLSVQSGMLVLQLHDCMLWALQRAGFIAAGVYSAQRVDPTPIIKGGPTDAGAGAPLALTPSKATLAGGEMEVAVLTDKTRSLVLQLMATLTSVTPYHRCPSAVERVKVALQLPYLRLVLRGKALLRIQSPVYHLPFVKAAEDTRASPVAETALDSFSGPSSGLTMTVELRAVISLLTHCIRRLGTQVNLGEYFTEEVAPKEKSGGRSRTAAPQGTSSPAVGTSAEQTLPTTSSSLLDALLANAPSFSPVWRCMTQLARFYPELIRVPERLEKLIRVSEEHIQHCFPLSCGSSTELLLPRYPPADEEGFLGLAELMRCWTHFMGYVWRAFDGKAEDPALNPQARHFHPIRPSGKDKTSDSSSSSVADVEANHRFFSAKASQKRAEAALQHDKAKREAAVNGGDCNVYPERASLLQKATLFRRVLLPVTRALRLALQQAEESRKARFTAVLQSGSQNHIPPRQSTSSKQQTKHTDPSAYGESNGAVDPAEASPPAHTEVLLATLRCAAQVSTECIMEVCRAAETESETDPKAVHIAAGVEDVVLLALQAARDPRAAVRTEALTTVGVWLWSYPSLDSYAVSLLHCAMDRLYHDDDVDCRTKAALALSNASARLPETPLENSTTANSSSTAAPHAVPCPFRNEPDVISMLCEAAAYTAVEEHGTSAIQHHGVRMMRMLLSVLTVDECIYPLDEVEDEVVAEAFLRLLNEFVSSARDPKLRWNAAIALGVAIHREEVFDAEPESTSKAITVLCASLRRDAMFKVRIRAAEALGGVCLKGLRGAYSDHGDFTPEVMDALCNALQSTESSLNGAEMESRSGSSSASSAHLFHGKEDLRRALLASLETLIPHAHPSKNLDVVLMRHAKLLQEHHIL